MTRLRQQTAQSKAAGGNCARGPLDRSVRPGTLAGDTSCPNSAGDVEAGTRKTEDVKSFRWAEEHTDKAVTDAEIAAFRADETAALHADEAALDDPSWRPVLTRST